MKKAYIFLAEGFEEIEAVTPLDLLRRKGIDAKFISITREMEVKGSHNIIIKADELFENVDFSQGDAFILPGGMPGTTNLDNHTQLKKVILEEYEKGKLICAICAGPLILNKLGILKDIEATIYPTMIEDLKDSIKTEKSVCVQNNVITGNALASAIDFSLEIVKYLASNDDKDDLKKEIVY